MTFLAPYSNRSNRTVHRNLQESSNRHYTQFEYLSEQDAKMDMGKTSHLYLKYHSTLFFLSI
jgi:hypothetical protein